jgi:ABC-type cobalamin transport system ATPase subunit
VSIAPPLFALACQSELKVAEFSVQYKTLEIEKLKFQIAKLRRMQFGRSSERISRQIEQVSRFDRNLDFLPRCRHRTRGGRPERVKLHGSVLHAMSWLGPAPP